MFGWTKAIDRKRTDSLGNVNTDSERLEETDIWLGPANHHFKITYRKFSS